MVVLGSTIVGLEHHTPQNMEEEIEHAVSHNTDFHQFMLHTRAPGTPLYAEMLGQGRMLKGIDVAGVHGQDKFNFRRWAFLREDFKRWLDRAFRHDFKRNGEVRWLRNASSALLRAMEHHVRSEAVVAGVRTLRRDIGRVLLWTTVLEERCLARGGTYEAEPAIGHSVSIPAPVEASR